MKAAACKLALPFALLAACAATRTPGEPPAVRGRVVLDGSVPEPQLVELEEDMRAATGRSHRREDVWMTTPDGGLANCAVLLHPAERGSIPPAEPVEARFTKVGADFVPPVLVVPAGSLVVFRNEDSPSDCFHTKARRNPALNTQLSPGQETSVRYEHAEAIRVGSAMRDWLHGAVLVTDAPYFALTDERGEFALEGVRPGTYDVTLWHEGTGKVRRGEVRVAEDGSARLELLLPAPAG
ncbi:MAG: carboxypeptidase-like regulatory domain-containing protein [Planctomycetota bacterium]